MSHRTPLLSNGSGQRTPTASDEFILAIIEDMVTNQKLDLEDKRTFERQLSEQIKAKCTKETAPKTVAKLKNFSAFDAKLRIRSLLKKGLMTPQGISTVKKKKSTVDTLDTSNSDAQSFRSNSTISYGGQSRISSSSGQNRGSVRANVTNGGGSRSHARRRSNTRGLSSLRSSALASNNNKGPSGSSWSSVVNVASPPSHSNRRLNGISKNTELLRDISPSDSFDIPAVPMGNTDLAIKKIDFDTAQHEVRDSSNGPDSLRSVGDIGFSPGLKNNVSDSKLQEESEGALNIHTLTNVNEKKKEKAQRHGNVSMKLPRTIFRPQHPLYKSFKKCQRALRIQLSQPYLPDTSALVGIDKQRLEVKRILERTLVDAENNSVLLVGARGGGKSLIVEHVLHGMKKKFSGTPKKPAKKRKRGAASASASSVLVEDLVTEDKLLSGRKRSTLNRSRNGSATNSSVARRPLLLHSPGSNESVDMRQSFNGSTKEKRRSNKRSRVTHPRIYLMGKIRNDQVDFARMVEKFNGVLSSSMTSSVTHIILQNHKIERTPELLENLAKPFLDRAARRTDRPAYIVSEEWLYANATAGYVVDESGYEPEDLAFERKYGVSLATAISRRRNASGLLQHCLVWISPNVQPGRTDLRRAISNAGGVLINSLPKPNSHTNNGFVPAPTRNSLADLSPLSPIAYSSRISNKRLLVVSTKEDLESDTMSSQPGRALALSPDESESNFGTNTAPTIISNTMTERLKALGVDYVYRVEVLLDGLLKHHLALSERSFMLMSLRDNDVDAYQIIPSPKSSLEDRSDDSKLSADSTQIDGPQGLGNQAAKDIDDDETLSKYEKDRLRRIRGNQEFLATLGLTSVRREIADAMGKPPSPKEIDQERNENSNNEEREDDGKDDSENEVRRNNVGQLSSTAPFVVIRLNGMAHADEKVALREISHQLFLDYESHKIGSRSFSFAHHLQLLLDVLREAKGVCVPIIFVLDEFQEFAKRSKQTLLYTLLDILQSGETQMAVVGLTGKIDVVESLEKRIQSRFSHRQIFVPPTSLEDKLKILKSRLTLRNELLSSDASGMAAGKSEKANVRQTRRGGGTSKAAKNLMEANIASFVQRWNDKLEELFRNKALYDAFKKYQDFGHSMKWFMNVATNAVTKLNFARTERESFAPPFLILNHFEKAFENYSIDRRELSFKSLNVVEMLLLISMSHLEKCNSIPYNFETIYEEYVRLLRFEDEGGSIGVSTYTFTKKIMFKAFEQLLALGLCTAVGAGSKTRFNGLMATQNASINQYDLHYQAVRLILDLKHVKELFRLENPHLPTLVKTWTQKWI